MQYLDEDQEVLEHDLESKEERDQEGAAYREQRLQCIEDDVANEVVESDERREDVECCSGDTEKWKHDCNIYLYAFFQVVLPVYSIHSLLENGRHCFELWFWVILFRKRPFAPFNVFPIWSVSSLCRSASILVHGF